ncbi:unnamed protein product [Lepidochelys kempii]
MLLSSLLSPPPTPIPGRAPSAGAARCASQLLPSGDCTSQCAQQQQQQQRERGGREGAITTTHRQINPRGRQQWQQDAISAIAPAACDRHAGGSAGLTRSVLAASPRPSPSPPAGTERLPGLRAHASCLFFKLLIFSTKFS